VTGSFNSSSLAFGTQTVTCSGNSDVFIVKYSPAGSETWAKSAAGSLADLGNSLVIDANGNIFVTGIFESPSITFGSVVITNANQSSSWISSDIFLVKYSSAGNVVWAKGAGGGGNDVGKGVTCDAKGNVILTGYFDSSPMTIGTTTVSAFGGNDLLIAKYSSAGAFLWVNADGGSFSDEGKSISTDVNGNTIIAGNYNSPALYFSGMYVIQPLLSTGHTADLFVAKLNDLFVGLDETVRTESSIRVYPNPVTSRAIISLSDPEGAETLKITDVAGREVFRISLSGNKEVTIDRNALQAGLYFIQVKDRSNNVLTGKMVVD
jgi:hypothetical protein